jgi:hypothetical protein
MMEYSNCKVTSRIHCRGVISEFHTYKSDSLYTVRVALHVATGVDCGIFMFCVEAGGEQLLITSDTR